MSSDLRLPDSPRGPHKPGVHPHPHPGQVSGLPSGCAPPTPAPRGAAEPRSARAPGGPGHHRVTLQQQSASQQPVLIAPGHAARLDSHNLAARGLLAANSPPGGSQGGLSPLYKGSGSQPGSNPHHLPESPPDSGSEPPFSPPHEADGKLPPGVAVALGQQPSPEMMPQPGHDGQMKHFVPYVHGGQHIKHLPHPSELNLNMSSQSHPSLHPMGDERLAALVQPQHLPPLHGMNPNPIHSDPTMLTQLNPAMMPGPHHGPMGLQPAPGSGMGMHPGPPQGHLTTLYGPGEDYMNSNCGDCGPETSGGSQTKKRKVSDSSKASNGHNGNMIHIKKEPLGNVSPEPTTTTMIDDFGFDYNGGHDGPSSVYLDSTYQCIRFQPFQQTNWHTLFDINMKEL